MEPELSPSESTEARPRLMANTLIVGFVTLGANLTIFARERLVAHHYGTVATLDIFLLAVIVPLVAMRIFGDNLRMAFVPVLMRINKQEGRPAARAFLARMMAMGLVLFVSVTVLLAALTPLGARLLGYELGEAGIKELQGLLFQLLPLLALSGLGMVGAGALHADNRFTLVAAAQGLPPVVCLIFIEWKSAEWGIVAYVRGMQVGVTAELMLILAGAALRGWRVWPRWTQWGPAFREISKRYWPLVISMIMLSSTPLIDRVMAGWLEEGSISTLSYGLKLSSFIFGVLGYALSIVVFSHFSRLVEEQNRAVLRKTLKVYIRTILLISMPAMVLCIYFSEPIVRLLFERGAFTTQDTAHVAGVQSMFLLQIPFYLITATLWGLFVAWNYRKAIIGITMLHLAIKIILNVWLMQDLGVAGVALATSLAHMVTAVLLIGLVRRMIGNPD